jgi:hypothetical protein
VEIKDEIKMTFIISLKNRSSIFKILTPNTRRIPISFCLFNVLYEIKPNIPVIDIIVAKNKNTNKMRFVIS